MGLVAHLVSGRTKNRKQRAAKSMEISRAPEPSQPSNQNGSVWLADQVEQPNAKRNTAE